MHKIPTSTQLLQPPLIHFDLQTGSEISRQKHTSINQTLCQIRSLKDKLNKQLYQYPTERPSINSPQDAAQILDTFIGYLDHEELWVINLDTRHHVMHLVALYKGSVNSSHVRIAEVFRQAIIDNAIAIILAHNHPSGNIEPSAEDVSVTRAVLQVGKILDIDLLDHIVIARGNYVSMKERGLGFS